MQDVASSSYIALMGDLVGSESDPRVERLYETFNNVISSHNKHHRKDIASPLTITLGDEFQGLIKSFVAGAKIMRSLRLELLAQDVDCRFVLGVVTLRTPLNKRKAWNMMGGGLADTRRTLNEKRSDRLYRFIIPQQPVVTTLLDALGAALTSIERSWTARQRQDIVEAISGASAIEIAQRRQISVYSVYKVRNSGDYDLYTSYWAAILEAMDHLDRASEPLP